MCGPTTHPRSTDVNASKTLLPAAVVGALLAVGACGGPEADTGEADVTTTQETSDQGADELPQQQAGKWDEPATSADGLHTFVASEPVAEKVTDDDDPDKQLDGVRIDLTYTNNSDVTIDALWDVQLTTFSGTDVGEPEWCEGYEGGRYEEPVPPGRTFEWSECFAVEDPEDVVLTIAPPMAEDGSIAEIIYGGQ